MDVLFLFDPPRNTLKELRRVPVLCFALTLSVSLLFVGPVAAQPVDSRDGPVRIVVEDFEFEFGAEGLVSLRQGFPEILTAAFLNYQPIEVMPRAAVWQAFATRMDISRSEYSQIANRIFNPDVLNELDIDYVLTGRFFERNGQIRLFLELRDPRGSNKRWKVGAFRIPTNQMFESVGGLASTIALKIGELGHSNYRNKTISIRCISVRLGKEDVTGDNNLEDLHSFLIDSLSTRLGQKFRGEEECNTQSMSFAWRDIDPSIDAIISGDVALGDTGPVWQGSIRIRQGDLELSTRRIDGSANDQMGFKSIVAKELAAFLSDLLTDTGDWEPTLIETVQMDSAKGYIDEASVSINANPPRLALAEFYLRQAEEVAQHLADSQERAEIARLVLLRSGDLAQKNSLPAQAERYYRGAIQHNPDWVEAYLSLGSFYVDQKRWEQALLAYKDAKRLAPGSESIYEQLAALHTILGDTKGAIETWDDLAKQNPASVTPFIGRAIIALDEGDTEKAVLYYEKAINLAKAPKAESLKAELTEILNEEGERRRYDREFQYAVQLYSQSLSFLRTAEALYWRGICYVRLNKYEDAITDFESLFSDPNFESSATAERKFSGFDLAETLILVGRHQEAVNVLSKILDDKSTAPELVGLAQYLMVVGLAFLGEDYTEEATELVRYLKETRSRATIGEIQWFFGLLLSHIEVSKDLDPRTRKSLVGLTHAAAIVLE